jgi:DNA-binding MarR family transcriptional regulator
LLTLVEDGGKRLTDLVDSMHLPKQTLGDMIDELERQKLVERYPDPDHGVIKRVRLAARGKTWASEVRKVADSAEARWTAVLGKAKVKQLRGLLEELASELANELGPQAGQRSSGSHNGVSARRKT